MKTKIIGILAIGAVIFVAVLIAVVSASANANHAQFKDILNFENVNNSNQLLGRIGTGIENNSEFNITYTANAVSSSNPLYGGLHYSANVSIARKGELLSVSLSTQSPSVISSTQQNSNEYWSASKYNGTGFLTCINDNSSCQYKKSNQSGDFAGEIASSFSNVFSSNFINYPYLSAMSGNYSLSNGSDFSLYYISSQTYSGNVCAYMQVTSTTAFYDMTGAAVSGHACFSEALGLPLYADLTVTYSSISFNLHMISSLAQNASI